VKTTSSKNLLPQVKRHTVVFTQQEFSAILQSGNHATNKEMHPTPLLQDYPACNNPRDTTEEAFTKSIHVRNFHARMNPIYLNKEAYLHPILDGRPDASMHPSDSEDDDQHHG
jgi:hypothetical protein